MKAALMVLLSCTLLGSCARLTRARPPVVPQDETRHRAALAELTVFNHTDQRLTIAFRSATPPVQEVVLGAVPPATRERVAPIPAGEPIILFARKGDGSELALEPRSFPLDETWTWDIPMSAVFRQP
ncbi:MAG: hypothetical protein ACRENP_18470 [Longimicrobiales bacterium]